MTGAIGTRTRMRCWRSDEQRHIVPSPLAGEGQGGGYNTLSSCCCPLTKTWHPTRFRRIDFERRAQWRTPLPVPPPQGGRERCGVALPTRSAALAYLPRQSITSLPQEGTTGRGAI